MLLCIHDHHDARSMIARAILAPKQLQKFLFCHMETGFVGAVRLVKAGIPEPHSTPILITRTGWLCRRGMINTV